MTKLITRRTALVTAAGLATTTMMRTPLAWGADKPNVRLSFAIRVIL